MDQIRHLALNSRKLPWEQRVETVITLRDELLREKEEDLTTISSFDEFEKWLDPKITAKVKFGFIESIGCNGVLCKEPCNKGETVFSVPRDCMMAVEDVYRGFSSAFLTKASQSDILLQRMPMLVLALYILEEHAKGAASKFHAYLNILPRCFGDLPLMWTKETFLALDGTFVADVAIERVVDSILYFVHLNGLVVSEYPTFSYQRFLWALGLVMTRQNPLPLADDPSTMGLAMIPVFDMCNHEVGTLTSSYDTDEKLLSCAAMDDCDANDEFRICYGKRTNSDLLVYSGFMLDRNPFDTLLVDLVGLLNRDDPLLKMKELILKKSPRWIVVHPERDQAMTISRIAVGDKDMLATQLRNSHGHGTLMGEYHSEENEKLATCWLASRIQDIIAERSSRSCQGIASQVLTNDLYKLSLVHF